MSYISKKLRFTDFTTQKKYHTLKIYYRCCSDAQPSIHEMESLDSKEDFKIKLDDIDDNGYVVGEVYRTFLDDFLSMNIPRMAEQHFNEFQRKIDEKQLYNPDAIKDYGKFVINQSLPWSSKIRESLYLNDEIKHQILQQLERYIQDIEHYSKYPFAYAEAKLKFNWNKADVLYFFHLLRENKQIEYRSNSEYGRFIDNMVEYKDGDRYSPITDSRKRLSAFNQKVPTIVTESKNRLLTTFSNPDFYKE
ncbi:hypothetical protein SAMN06265375_101431 [Muriicola jejuensis]|uniref:Uncharacterized protein n=1 Tax=Muriicola jejuensis TaxID=504488 RepID=A0A6P0UE77_9FLAO|nr:hypothetical protein [Muriicola jejuensis]NER10038.1 hypothetical protein [Muriicola jejuensis]SMP03556.1 hypothetical protein SAMN06265375_101431 [Muriicola jejuensis]